ncbi:MAG: glycosyl transferase [Chloroflexi bacterium]|nr:MAG: glycosyl transferase [Chloroflexota bacterium]PIE82489.1 MAG: glycosyl transferase [Chloroflexota bacterium]
MIEFLGMIYVLTVATLSLFGFLGLFTLWLYWRHRHDKAPCPTLPAELPSVTIQLPIFNEKYVVERLIKAAVSQDYPADKLHIQVLDDSTDDTTDIAADLVTHYKKQGIHIDLIHRNNRIGYKAGALAAALPAAQGEFVAIFDADFEPTSDFLQKTIPYFTNEPELGMIQARWGHLNPDDSALTAAQAIALDKHFAMEQTVRHRANIYPKFNGAGGIWRRTCMEDAGGWQDDTVCEDLDLSTRAILKGWQFRFLNDVTAPAELPTSITAYKSQQARWAKGSTQCLGKFGWDILTDQQHSLGARLYALVSMSAYSTHLLLLVLLFLQIPLIYWGYSFPSLLFVFSLIAIGQPLLFVLGQQVLYPDWLKRLRHFPTLLVVAIGLAPSNSRAILQAFSGGQHVFVRTPKTGLLKGNPVEYRLPFDWIVIAEVFLAVYALAGLLLAISQRNWGPTVFLGSCTVGFGYVAWLSLRELVNR